MSLPAMAHVVEAGWSIVNGRIGSLALCGYYVTDFKEMWSLRWWTYSEPPWPLPLCKECGKHVTLEALKSV